MSWRLIDALQNEQRPLRKGVLQVFYLESNAMAAVPFETKKALRMTVNRLLRTSLTKPGWVHIGDSYGEATPEFDPIQEQTYKIGRDIDTAKEYADGIDGEYEDMRALGTEAALKAIVYEFNEAFINGPNIGAGGAPEAKALVGIQERIAAIDLQSGLGDARTPAGTNGVLFGPTATSANRHAVLDKLNTVIYFIDGHAPDWAFCNQTFLLALESALRQEGLFNSDRDQFDRFVYRYRNVEMYDIGLKADQATKIIADTETEGSSTDCTSVYFGKNGVDTHFWLWESAPLDVRDLGELQTAPTLRTRVDWTLGMVNAHPRALGRVSGIRAGT